MFIHYFQNRQKKCAADQTSGVFKQIYQLGWHFFFAINLYLACQSVFHVLTYSFGFHLTSSTVHIFFFAIYSDHRLLFLCLFNKKFIGKEMGNQDKNTNVVSTICVLSQRTSLHYASVRTKHAKWRPLGADCSWGQRSVQIQRAHLR